MASLSSTLDYIGGIIVVASMGAGVFQVSSSLGSISQISSGIVKHPLSFGLGLFLFLVGYATWSPAIPQSFLARYGFGWLTVLYPFTKGYFMSFSLWALLFSLIVTIIVTLLAMRVWELDFWFHGFLVALAAFFLSWYLWGWIAWKLMYVGGGMMSLSDSQIYTFWQASITSTSSLPLQVFFLATSPISALWLTRKVASLL
jgi:hypothetical protein